jgi:hypothetical protein
VTELKDHMGWHVDTMRHRPSKPRKPTQLPQNQAPGSSLETQATTGAPTSSRFRKGAYTTLLLPAPPAPSSAPWAAEAAQASTVASRVARRAPSERPHRESVFGTAASPFASPSAGCLKPDQRPTCWLFEFASAQKRHDSASLSPR